MPLFFPGRVRNTTNASSQPWVFATFPAVTGHCAMREDDDCTNDTDIVWWTIRRGRLHKERLFYFGSSVYHCVLLHLGNFTWHFLFCSDLLLRHSLSVEFASYPQHVVLGVLSLDECILLQISSVYSHEVTLWPAVAWLFTLSAESWRQADASYLLKEMEQDENWQDRIPPAY